MKNAGSTNSQQRLNNNIWILISGALLHAAEKQLKRVSMISRKFPPHCVVVLSSLYKLLHFVPLFLLIAWHVLLRSSLLYSEISFQLVLNTKWFCSLFIFKYLPRVHTYIIITYFVFYNVVCANHLRELYKECFALRLVPIGWHLQIFVYILCPV